MRHIFERASYAVLAFLAGACVGPAAELDRPCPCWLGWTCCEQENVCVPPGQQCSAQCWSASDCPRGQLCIFEYGNCSSGQCASSCPQPDAGHRDAGPRDANQPPDAFRPEAGEFTTCGCDDEEFNGECTERPWRHRGPCGAGVGADGGV